MMKYMRRNDNDDDDDNDDNKKKIEAGKECGEGEKLKKEEEEGNKTKEPCTTQGNVKHFEVFKTSRRINWAEATKQLKTAKKMANKINKEKEKNAKVKVESKAPMNSPHCDGKEGGSQLKINKENPIFAMFDRRGRMKSDTRDRGEKRRGTIVSGEKEREVIKVGQLQSGLSVEKDQEIDRN